jgi:predicted DNA-binding transcriptional regulator AlpA
MDQLVTGATAAAMLQLSPRTLASWRRIGVGPKYVKITGRGRGGSVRYQISDIEAWLETRRVEPGGEE